jgi:phosphorylcholine metabolism protein LicD
MESNNYKKPDAGCDIYGVQRLTLATYLRDNILNQLDYTWFIENGTLLGAWRNGSFIPHDDDFDIAILVNNQADIDKITDFINTSLISQYQSRLVTTYATKIEVFDPTYGKYLLLGEKYNKSDYHYVTLDIQFYMKTGSHYKTMYYISPITELFDPTILTPTGKIQLEGESFPTPGDIEAFLKIKYGSLSPKAKFNKISGLYEE